jgi:hypothetical protein
MSQTFVFEELDATTREYLTAVRDAQGQGAPGVFAPTSSSLAGCGMIGGPVVIVATLLLTLTTWVNVIYKDPTRVAFLQTAGLLVGGWLLFAGIRAAGAKGSRSQAGNWVYVDPLYLYEAHREQVRVTPVADAVEANYTHNYNNGSYQNSVVRVLLGGGRTAAVTLNSEARAEQMVVYLNYLAWARGPDGGDRAALAPASLGGLAKYVAAHDAEPKDAEDHINLNLVELDITGVPEEPAREGRAAPNFLPYVLMLAGGAAVFFLMAKVVNPPLRDDALYDAVISEPAEPRFLRAYLIDERNTRHRAEVLARLARIYDDAALKLENPAADKRLRGGMLAVLKSLKDADQPFVSLSVEELAPRPGAEARVKKLRDELVGTVTVRETGAVDVGPDGILGVLAQVLPPVPPPPGTTFDVTPPPLGVQLIDFAEKPKDAEHAHFEVTYQFVQLGGSPRYALDVTVEVRTNVDPEKGNTDPVAVYQEKVQGNYGDSDAERERAVTGLKDRLLAGLVRPAFGANPPFGAPRPFPQFDP